MARCISHDGADTPQGMLHQGPQIEKQGLHTTAPCRSPKEAIIPDGLLPVGANRANAMNIPSRVLVWMIARKVLGAEF